LIKVPHPSFSPTHCATCGANKCDDGFVDMLVTVPVHGWNDDGTPRVVEGSEFPVWGRLYQCAWCVRQAAKLVGCAVPETVQELLGKIGEAQAEAARLADELEAVRATTLTPDDLATLKQALNAKPRTNKQQAAA
jgi:hypothetical protein